MLTKDLAICIRAADFSETSQIVTLFTRASGKIKAIAKGSKRAKSAFGGAIEIFSYGKIVFADSTREKLATLTEFESAYGGPGFTNLASNSFTLNCSFFAAELLDLLTDEHDPHPELFDSFLQFLQDTNEGRETKDEGRRTRDEGRRTLALLILFQLSLLKEIGLMPILDYCVNCKTRYEGRGMRDEGQGMRDEGRGTRDVGRGTRDEGRGTRDVGRGTKDETNWSKVYFSSSANGLICRDCEASFPDKIRVSKNAAGCLTNLKMLAESNEKTLNEVEKILIHHFTELLHRPPKMAKHVLENQKPQQL